MVSWFLKPKPSQNHKTELTDYQYLTTRKMVLRLFLVKRSCFTGVWESYILYITAPYI